MGTLEKFGKHSDQFKELKKFMGRLADETDNEVGKAMCGRCERVFGHSGYIKQVFTCPDCFLELENERFFIGKMRGGWNPWLSKDRA